MHAKKTATNFIVYLYQLVVNKVDVCDHLLYQPPFYRDFFNKQFTVRGNYNNILIIRVDMK